MYVGVCWRSINIQDIQEGYRGILGVGSVGMRYSLGFPTGDYSNIRMVYKGGNSIKHTAQQIQFREIYRMFEDDWCMFWDKVFITGSLRE